MPIKTKSSPPPSESSDPVAPPKQKRKAGTTPSSSSSTDSIDKKSSSAKKPKLTPPGAMTANVKEALIGHMMRIACSAVNKEELAAELGITKKQLDNAICSGRINLRSKLVKAAREL